MVLTKKWVMDKTIGGQFTSYHPIDEKGNIVAGLSFNEIPEGEELVGEMAEDDKGNITIVPIKVTVIPMIEGMLKGIENVPTKDLRNKLSFILKRLCCLEQAVIDICDNETKEKIEARQKELVKENK